MIIRGYEITFTCKLVYLNNYSILKCIKNEVLNGKHIWYWLWYDQRYENGLVRKLDQSGAFLMSCNVVWSTLQNVRTASDWSYYSYYS